MIDRLIEQYADLIKRKDFKPFEDLPAKQVAPPIRKRVKAVADILMHAEHTSETERVQFAQMAGIKLEEGKVSFEIKYSEQEALDHLAVAVFDIDRDEVKDWDNLNEGEVYAALNFFLMKRKGI